MKLYSYFRSSAAYRVRIALNIKGLRYETVSTSLPKGAHLDSAYLARNPQGLIPALETDDAVLSQSIAIIEYLDATYPDPPLLPADTLAQAHVRSMALAIACDIHPLNNLRVLNYLRSRFQADDTIVAEWYRHWIGEGFKGLEAQALNHSRGRQYCFGNSLTLADVLLVPQMFNARRFEADLSTFPTLVTICTHLESLPAFHAARPEAQPDSEGSG